MGQLERIFELFHATRARIDSEAFFARAREYGADGLPQPEALSARQSSQAQRAARYTHDRGSEHGSRTTSTRT